MEGRISIFLKLGLSILLMVKKIFITLWAVLLIISCSSFAKINMKKDPNKFYFDDYIDGKNFKHEEAEKQFLKVFPLGSDVDEVMIKIKESEKGWSCYYDNAWKYYGCTKKKVHIYKEQTQWKKNKNK